MTKEQLNGVMKKDGTYVFTVEVGRSGRNIRMREDIIEVAGVGDQNVDEALEEYILQNVITKITFDGEEIWNRGIVFNVNDWMPKLM